MRKLKYTTEEFVQKCKEVHGSTYSYENTVYTGAMEYILITCPTHGDFQVCANSYIRGSGCMKCFRDRQGDVRKLSQEEWLKRATEIHGNKYDYSLVEYKHQNQTITIICPEHGKFTGRAGTHALGQAYCKKCRTRPPGTPRSSQDHYISKVRTLHGDRYNYSKVHYVRLADKIDVLCRDHGVFSVKAGNHASGRGCPACAKHGFKVNKPASLYILEVDNITKIGVTNRKVSDRASKIRKSSSLPFKIFSEFKFDLGRDAMHIETILLNELKDSHEQPSDVFDGSTECFLSVDKSRLVSRIGELISEINKGQHSPSHASQEA